METDKINNNLFHLNPLPSWIYDIETLEILDVNSTATGHYGYTREEFLRLTLKDLRPAQEIPKLQSSITVRKKNEGNIYIGIFTHQKKDGTLIQMDINGHKVDFQGRNCVLVICQDVTDKEKQIRQLKESEENLKAISALSKIGYWRLQIDGMTLSWTDEVYDIWEQNRDDFELTFDNVSCTIHPDDREAFQEMHRASFAGEKDYNVIHRIIVAEGKIKWVHEIGRLKFDLQGNVVSFEGTVQDVTAQKEEEQRLKLLESVITNTNDAVLITEADPFDEPGPRIIYVNESFTKMTGYEACEVIGRTPRILQGPNSNQKELAKLSKAMRNRESCEITTINYKKNGEEFWVNFTVSPVIDENGRYTHCISIERDVTEQKNKELENELVAQIGSFFNHEKDYARTTNDLCKAISQFGKFDWVELWTSNFEKTKMHLINHHVANSEDEEFYCVDSKIDTFQKSKGLPGKVWADKTQLLWTDIEASNDFVRKKAAKKIGLKSVLGVPLISKNEVHGVLTIGTKQNTHLLKKYSRIFKRLEGFIGSELKRTMLENDLSHLFDAIPDIVSVGDFQGRFLTINKAGSELMGYSEEEILYQTFEKFIHPEDRTIALEELSRLASGQTTFNFEVRFIRKSGEILWLSWFCNTNMEEGLIYSTAKNITEEKKLRELNRQSRQLAKIGSWELDLINQTLYWSDEVHQMHETDPASFVPDLATGINFYREDFRPMVRAGIEKTGATGEPFDFEAVLVSSNKKERWVRAIGNAELVDGKCQRIYGSVQDITERKEAAEELQKAYDDKNNIIESIADAFFTMDRNFIVSYWNRAAEELIGVQREKLIGKNLWEVFPDAVSLPSYTNYHKVLETGKPITFEDNYGGWLEVNAYPSEEGLTVLFRDISLKKGADQRLLEAFEQKNNILESIGDAFFALDKNWIVTYWNKEAEVILGRKREEMVGENLWEKYADAIDSDFYRQCHKAQETGENLSFEEYYATLNKWFEVSVYPSKEGLSVYFKDVTLRKEADIRLIQANERFEKVTEATSDAIWDWDILNDSFYRSQNVLKLFGKTTSLELTTKDFWNDAFHPDDLEEIKKSISEALENPKIFRWEREYRIYNESGNIIYLIDRGVIIRDPKGKPIRMIGAMTDITVRKNHEEELLTLNESLQTYAKDLERSNEELEQFAFITSHDLQEPLRMIASFMDLLKRKYGEQLDEKALQYIYFASDGAKRMKQIILDLLDYSRAGKQTDSIEQVNLIQVLSDYKQLRRKVILEKSVTISASELPTIYSYKAGITQVFHSLLDNAIKYSKEGIAPHIEIYATEEINEWKFFVKDNGIGIDPEFYDKIFIIFQRLHSRKDFEGTGIGLSIAKKHVEFLGGKIWVESSPGKGSTFYFSSPKQNIKLPEN